MNFEKIKDGEVTVLVNLLAEHYPDNTVVLYIGDNTKINTYFEFIGTEDICIDTEIRNNALWGDVTKLHTNLFNNFFVISFDFLHNLSDIDKVILLQKAKRGIIQVFKKTTTVGTGGLNKHRFNMIVNLLNTNSIITKETEHSYFFIKF